jgi:NADP-dependent 3-hydroxy acid dehydrogenase YdfG
MTGKKVVVITGASAGIGAALARRLGTDGHALVLCARRERELRQVAAESGTDALPVVADVTRRADVENLLEVALKRFGRVDVWVNNAGRGINRKVLDLTDEDIDTVLAVNVKSALYGMQCVVPYFQKVGGGHLINVSSFLGRVPMVSNRSVYSAAKSALNILTANLRVDLKATHSNIHVTLVMPGVVMTDFAANSINGAPLPPNAAAAMGAQTPEEAAAAIASVIEKPTHEIYTNPASASIAKLYFEDIAAFEENAARRR